MPGEEFTHDETCNLCPRGTYSLIQPTEVTYCEPCEDNALCFGGNNMAPRPNHWRADEYSTEFLECWTEDACLGGNEYSPTGFCEEGYEGILCGQCTSGYYQFGAAHSCYSCGDYAAFSGFLVLSIILVLFWASLINAMSFSNALI